MGSWRSEEEERVVVLPLPDPFLTAGRSLKPRCSGPIGSRQSDSIFPSRSVRSQAHNVH